MLSQEINKSKSGFYVKQLVKNLNILTKMGQDFPDLLLSQNALRNLVGMMFSVRITGYGL